MFMFSQIEEEGRLVMKSELKHSPQYQKEFEAWLGSRKQKAMLKLIAANCAKKQADDAIELMESPVVGGLVYIYNQERWSENEFLFLFDYLSDKLEEKGYQPKPSIVEKWQHKDYIEKMQRTHLVGQPEHAIDKILLSLYYHDGKMESLKCCGCTFTKKNRPERNPFHDLLAEITSNSL